MLITTSLFLLIGSNMNLTYPPTSCPARFITSWRVNLGRGEYCGMHQHANWELVYHKQSFGRTCLADQNSHRFAAQSMVLYAAHTMHEQYCDRNGVDHCIHMKIDPELARQLPGCTVSPVIHDSDLINNCVSLSHTRLPGSGPNQQALDHQTSFILLRFLNAVDHSQPRRQSPQANHVIKARQYIMDHFRSIENIQEVAQQVGIGYDHLRHLFTEQCGMSLNQYLILARIERSKQLLQHSVLTHAQIAQMVGFSNGRYFNTRFKMIVGRTPGQYRKQAH